MLGWDFIVLRQSDVKRTYEHRSPFATWETGPFGIGWIKRLVSEGKALDLGGDGYPISWWLGT